jgi:hypothetical protein
MMGRREFAIRLPSTATPLSRTRNWATAGSQSPQLPRDHPDAVCTRETGATANAASERILSMVTGTSPPVVQKPDSQGLQSVDRKAGQAIRQRSAFECEVRKSTVEVLARSSRRTWPI